MTEGVADVSGNPLYWWQGKDNGGPQLILRAMSMDRILDVTIGREEKRGERMTRNMMMWRWQEYIEGSEIKNK